jgi:hypothetical protein
MLKLPPVPAVAPTSTISVGARLLRPPHAVTASSAQHVSKLPSDNGTTRLETSERFTGLPIAIETVHVAEGGRLAGVRDVVAFNTGGITALSELGQRGRAARVSGRPPTAPDSRGRARQGAAVASQALVLARNAGKLDVAGLFLRRLSRTRACGALHARPGLGEASIRLPRAFPTLVIPTTGRHARLTEAANDAILLAGRRIRRLGRRTYRRRFRYWPRHDVRTTTVARRRIGRHVGGPPPTRTSLRAGPGRLADAAAFTSSRYSCRLPAAVVEEQQRDERGNLRKEGACQHEQWTLTRRYKVSSGKSECATKKSYVSPVKRLKRFSLVSAFEKTPNMRRSSAAWK